MWRKVCGLQWSNIIDCMQSKNVGMWRLFFSLFVKAKFAEQHTFQSCPGQPHCLFVAGVWGLSVQAGSQRLKPTPFPSTDISVLSGDLNWQLSTTSEVYNKGLFTDVDYMKSLWQKKAVIHTVRAAFCKTQWMPFYFQERLLLTWPACLWTKRASGGNAHELSTNMHTEHWMFSIFPFLSDEV